MRTGHLILIQAPPVENVDNALCAVVALLVEVVECPLDNASAHLESAADANSVKINITQLLYFLV